MVWWKSSYKAIKIFVCDIQLSQQSYLVVLALGFRGHCRKHRIQQYIWVWLQMKKENKTKYHWFLGYPGRIWGVGSIVWSGSRTQMMSRASLNDGILSQSSPFRKLDDSFAHEWLWNWRRRNNGHSCTEKCQQDLKANLVWAWHCQSDILSLRANLMLKCSRLVFHLEVCWNRQNIDTSKHTCYVFNFISISRLFANIET